MSIDLNLFQVYTSGYLKACPGLTDKEVELLPLGAKIITLELAVRFLTDYLNGDCYFKTDYEEHNLVRARTQMKLVADMERKWSQMQQIVRRRSRNTITKEETPHMKYLGIDYSVRNLPELDPDFIPFGVWIDAYERGAAQPLTIAIERDQGQDLRSPHQDPRHAGAGRGRLSLRGTLC